MASILHNPKQVIDQSRLRELSNKVDSSAGSGLDLSLKTLSRADSYLRHSIGGSVNFRNFKLLEAHNKLHVETEQ